MVLFFIFLPLVLNIPQKTRILFLVHIFQQPKLSPLVPLLHSHEQLFRLIVQSLYQLVYFFLLYRKASIFGNYYLLSGKFFGTDRDETFETDLGGLVAVSYTHLTLPTIYSV